MHGLMKLIQVYPSTDMSLLRIAGLLLVVFVMNTSCAQQKTEKEKEKAPIEPFEYLSDSQWKDRLTEFEYYVLRDKGTERAFTGEYWNHKEDGTYTCGGCGLELFSSDTKYASGSGWPSYWQPINPDNVKIVEDRSMGMVRDEVVCARCEGHLGHVFNDGPKPTGLRYCVNSISLDFVEKDKK